MKTIVLFAVLLISFLSSSAQEFGYDISVKRGIPVTLAQLDTAQSLLDLNANYPHMMIADKAYLSTKLYSECNELTYSSSSLNDNLSIEQKKMLGKLKQGCYIEVEVNYFQENAATLVQELRMMNFILRVEPNKEATFIGGEEKLIAYFQENLSGKLISAVLEENPLVIEFTVDEKGKAQDLMVTLGTEEETINEHILEVVRNMPAWIPAEDSTGNKIKQPFVFTAGSMVGC